MNIQRLTLNVSTSNVIKHDTYGVEGAHTSEQDELSGDGGMNWGQPCIVLLSGWHGVGGS